MFDGVSGRVAARVMARMNAAAEHEAVRRLRPGAGDRVLVIGFGPGLGLQALLETDVGRVVGVDPSNAMVRAAAARNRTAIARGRLELLRQTVAEMGDGHDRFDGAIAVHTLQICRPFEATAQRLASALRPGARLVSITHAWAARKDHGSEARFIETVLRGLADAGFGGVSYGRADAEDGTAILIEAVR